MRLFGKEVKKILIQNDSFYFWIVCHLLEQERQQHNQLKHTWQKANDQFLESQRLLMRDMQRMEIVLTSEQLRQVEELKKKDQVICCFPFFFFFLIL